MSNRPRDNRNPQRGPNRGSQRGDDHRPARVTLNKKVITEGGDLLVEKAEQLARELSEIKRDRDKLSTSQIRNIYGAVKKMQMKGELDTHKLAMLKPKLAYTAKRHGMGAEKLKDVLTDAISFVENDLKNFNRFVDFFEAILAYHRAYGGK